MDTMQPNAVGLARLQEYVVRRLRSDVSRIMQRYFDFFFEYHPGELARRMPLSGSEAAAIAETVMRLRGEVQKAWDSVAKDEEGNEVQVGFVAMYGLQPSRMTSRKTDLANLIIRHFQMLLGHEDPEATRMHIPPQGIMVELRGDRITEWAQGKIAPPALEREITRRAESRRPMTKSEERAELQRLWDEGWRPDVNVWIGRWLRTVSTVLYRIYTACFEFTEEIRIRYLKLTEDQTRALYGEFGDEQADAIMAAKYAEAQRKADETGLHVQIIDRQGNIVGEKVPSQEIEKYVRQLASRRGKASRGDWSRRKKLDVPGPVRVQTMTENPGDDEAERAMLALWAQLL